MSIAEMLLPEFDQEMAKTRAALERCPEDRFGWKPHERCFSMAELATHIANMQEWTVETMAKTSSHISVLHRACESLGCSSASISIGV